MGLQSAANSKDIYDNANRLTSRGYPNSVNTTYEYDGMSRLTRLKDLSATATLFDRQYSYNTASQISQIVEPSQTRTFGYDNVDRLTSVTNPTNRNESYVFDGVGNRTSSHLSTSYTYQPFNRVTATQTGSYRYDPNGNMVSKSEGSNRWMYLWDYENRLSQALDRKQRVKYYYDALGRRVRRILGYGKEDTKFIYDGLDVVIDDDTNSGITKYQNGLGIDNKLRQTTGSNANYFLADHLGSTNGLTNSTGTLTASNTYDSFGNASNNNFPTRYQFTGREYDNFTGLQYSRARFYDPNLGRFISEDPIGFGGGDMNLYGYVRNQPLIFRDSRGLFPDGDVLNPNILAPLGGALSGLGAAVGAAASSPTVVAGAGFALGYAIGYYPGQWLAAQPWNPVVNGPLNPWTWGTPYPNQSDSLPKLTSPTTNTRPTCGPRPQSVPFYRTPTITWPEEEPDDDGCAEEITGCSKMCAGAATNPNLPHVYGGSMEECLNRCVPERCKKGKHWKRY